MVVKNEGSFQTTGPSISRRGIELYSLLDLCGVHDTVCLFGRGISNEFICASYAFCVICKSIQMVAVLLLHQFHFTDERAVY